VVVLIKHPEQVVLAAAGLVELLEHRVLMVLQIQAAAVVELVITSAVVLMAGTAVLALLSSAICINRVKHGAFC
jgi:hypothetical protein